MPHVLVYVATSLDGYIARPDGGLDWLPQPPEGDDFGFAELLASVDALLMGRATYEMVQSFDGPWPYGDTPVVVLSNSLTAADLAPKPGARVSLERGEPEAILARLAATGIERIYLDGGQAVQRFLAADCVDELILTRVPVLIGAGISLFGALPSDRHWTLIDTKRFPAGLTQSAYRRASSKA